MGRLVEIAKDFASMVFAIYPVVFLIYWIMEDLLYVVIVSTFYTSIVLAVILVFTRFVAGFYESE